MVKSFIKLNSLFLQSIEARKDHACLYVELETTKGLLVTGGLGVEGQVLHSAEFYDIKAQKWSQVSSLKIGRTEHSMALIYGIPTAIGGEFYAVKIYHSETWADKCRSLFKPM